MSLSTVLFLFLAHLGVGIVFTLVFVSRDAGVKFFRFNAGLAAILLAIALAFRSGASDGRVDRRGSRWRRSRSSCRGGDRASTGRRSAASLASIRPAIVAVACVAGLIALVAAGARRLRRRVVAGRRR